MRRIIRQIIRWSLITTGVAITVIVVWCLIPTKPTIPPIMPRPNTQYWTMSNGYRIAYTHIPAPPDSAKPPIIFLHGGPGGYVHSSVINLLTGLAETGHSLYFYDQAGSGLSDRLPKPKDYSFLGHVQDLCEIITMHVEAKKVILIGHSYGGQLAAQLTAMHPNLVAQLVLSSPGELQPSVWENGEWVNLKLYQCPDSLVFTTVDRTKMDGLGFWTVRGLASMAIRRNHQRLGPAID